MRIRSATTDDKQALAALHAASIRAHCAGHYTPQQIAAWTALLVPGAYDDALENKVFLVAEEDGRLLGLGMLGLDGLTGSEGGKGEAQVDALYLGPGDTGRGLGAVLLRALEAEAVSRGATWCTTSATLNAEGFYARHGYERVLEAEHELPCGTPLACVAMVKPLGDM